VTSPLRARWLGRVRYRDGHALQRALWARGDADYLLLLEHPHVYTLGVRAKLEHVLVPPAEVGAELVKTDRGGDVTYHGPGQLVGYPIVEVPGGTNAVPGHVHAVEQLVIDALADVGVAGASRTPDLPGVWIGNRKICAIGVRVSKGRSMHGFALNVDPDMTMFDHIVPCGLRDYGVTSIANESAAVPMRDVVDAVVERARARWGPAIDRQDVAWKDPSPRPAGHPVKLLGRLAQAGVDTARTVAIDERKPDWLRVKADMGPEYRRLKRTMRNLDLVTVCEEAGCPNIFDCWNDGTATFMINGDRCTRACGFCLVDTRRPEPLDELEPERVADAVERLRLAHAVVTAVARDDLPDGGAAAFAEVVRAVRRRAPSTTIELLIPDCKGDPDALATIFDARPDVLNHNLETVARLQRAVRPNASYARSLAVLARAKDAGLRTKSGLIVGMGEDDGEVRAAMGDLRAVGVDILTIGQYLRPTAAHLPVVRWWEPAAFDAWRDLGVAMGFAHVEASPLTRSSYHAREASDAAASTAVAN
jgi:lipoic acid synthetase